MEIEGKYCLTGASVVQSDSSPGPLDALVPRCSAAQPTFYSKLRDSQGPGLSKEDQWTGGRPGLGGSSSWLTVEGVGVVFFLSRPGRGLAGTLAVLLAFRPVSSSGRLFSALLL